MPNIWMGAGAVLLAAAGSVCSAQPTEEYLPLAAPLGAIVSGCLDQSYDMDSARDCGRLSRDACLAMGPGGATTYGMAMCATILTDLWDAELNRLWPLVQAEFEEPEAAEHLLEEQRAWVAHKDAACYFAVAEVAGGSMAAHVGGDCAVTMTAERVASFLEILRYL